MTYLQATLLNRMDKLLQLRSYHDLNPLGQQIVDRSIYTTLIECDQAGIGQEARDKIEYQLDRAAGLHRYYNGLNDQDEARRYAEETSFLFGELVLSGAGQGAFAVLDRNGYDARRLSVAQKRAA